MLKPLNMFAQLLSVIDPDIPFFFFFFFFFGGGGGHGMRLNAKGTVGSFGG